MSNTFNIYDDLGIERYFIRKHIGERDWIAYAHMFEQILKEYSIPDDQLARAETVYGQIADYLNEELKGWGVEFSFYPQGSLAQKTTVKNSSSNKFDLDLIARRDSYSPILTPLQLLDMVEEALRRHPVFGRGLEQKNRCVMLPLPGEGFTVDITPGIPTGGIWASVEKTDPLVVGDRKEKQKASNPKGFSTWLGERADMQPAFKAQSRGFVLDESASSEPIPKQDKSLDDVLRRTIQLLKLHRNAYYRKHENQDVKKFQPISILISTLAAKAYETSCSTPHLSPVELLLEVIESMPYYIEKKGGKYTVDNPTVDGENFADKWNDEKTGKARVKAFINWHQQVCIDMRTLLTSQDKQSIRDASKRAFGDFGTSLAASLIATTEAEARTSAPGDGLLQRLNPIDPSRTYSAPKETNHA